ncbi:hypothetical protein [Liquorilactobacillus capillatus]|uniref:Uncharacterized protein n=1 Tax=Liquorilactobacillus capillatus DSM 19910 TaxID=1423731 RepID=A0A0R1MC40_9LACO|nr:hypothetical protein [Liquorilactobacillus capillatus]KRL01851.1 hypothetical protein FC81_GL001064 [Liquorilactobacillus capillatus DSM 19910]
MRDNIVYVYLERVSHLTLSYGISVKNFMAGVEMLPTNLLSLGPVDPNQEIDIYSGFNMYIGIDDVRSYLTDKQNKNQEWIDFDNAYDIEALTPTEVSELLYLGHAYTHLKSPFYYKLQNNYVYLTLPNGAKKVYYRNLPQFYKVLAKCLTGHLAEVYREKKSFLRLRYKFIDFPTELAKQMFSLMINGVVFDFGGAKIKGQEAKVPILIAPDSVYQLKWHEPTMLVEKSKVVGNLKYHLNTRMWELEVLSPQAFEDTLDF